MLYFKNDLYIGRCLSEEGVYALEELEFLGRFLRAGDWVVDGGANIGCHSLYFSGLVGASGGVLAFEPQRLVFQVLCANLALNELDNVFAFGEALGNCEEMAFVPVLDYARVNNFGGVGLSSQGEPVRRLRLDDLGLPRCRLVKLDVEGSEVEALEGMVETLGRCRPILYVENDRPSRPLELLESLGYRCYWHCPLISPQLEVRSLNLLCLLREHQELAGDLVECRH